MDPSETKQQTESVSASLTTSASIDTFTSTQSSDTPSRKRKTQPKGQTETEAVARKSRRRKKHSEIEQRRRGRLRQHYQQLEHLCVISDPTLADVKRDRDTVLVNAIRIMETMQKQLDTCRREHPPAPAPSLPLPSPSAATSASTASSSAPPAADSPASRSTTAGTEALRAAVNAAITGTARAGTNSPPAASAPAAGPAPQASPAGSSNSPSSAHPTAAAAAAAVASNPMTTPYPQAFPQLHISMSHTTVQHGLSPTMPLMQNFGPVPVGMPHFPHVPSPMGMPMDFLHALNPYMAQFFPSMMPTPPPAAPVPPPSAADRKDQSSHPAPSPSPSHAQGSASASSSSSSTAATQQGSTRYHASRFAWVILHLNGAIHVANDAALAFLGLKPEDIQGPTAFARRGAVSFLDAIHPDDLGGMYQNLHSLLQKQRVSVLGNRRLKRGENNGGAYASVNMVTCLRNGTDGTLEGYECIFMLA